MNKVKNLILLLCILLVSCSNNKSDKHTITLKKTALRAKDTVQSARSNEYLYDNDVSELGIGLIIVPEKFKVYSDSLLTNKPLVYDMTGDEKKINICSKFFKPDYGIMHFVCIGISAKAYKVIANYNEVKYLPKREGYLFDTWESYMTGSFGIRRSKTEEDRTFKVQYQPLRVQPFKNADTLKIPHGLEMFCPIKIKGDWVNVKYDCFYNGDEHESEPCSNYINKCKDPLSGWLKWREANKLLIDIFIME